jgi:thiosulfate reductase/polysulfide reductase chain A
MSPSPLTRRQFIKIAGAATAAAAAASGIATRWWGLDRDPIPDPGTEGETIVPSFCELCFWKCGVLAHVREGKVTKITGNPDHPLSRGRLCPRGAGGTGLLYDPDRLKKPLLRTRDRRGEQAFREAEWDEALDLVAQKLLALREKHGPEALALFLHGYGGSWFKHLVKAYGSPNISAPSYAQCRGPREVGYFLTFGAGIGSPERTDMENSRCLTLIGSHLGENMHNTQVQEFAQAKSKGCGLVVVDPRFSVAASKADFWLPIKPGTDIALLLAWIHVILKENLFDQEYVAKHAIGLEELKQHVADKTPEWAYTHTTLAPDSIVQSARFIAAARPASLVHPGRRTTWYGDDTQRARAMAILAALLGSWGRQGGFFYPVSMEIPEFPYTKYGHKPRPPVDMPKGRAYPLADELLSSGLRDASVPGVAEYDIKGWLVYGTNLIQSLPDPDHVRKAIQELELLVAVDVLPAEICGWADVVLPESTYLERCDDLYAAPYKVPFTAVRQKVVEPMYDSKPGWWIARELGRRIGLSDYFPWADSEEYAIHRVHAAGASCDELKRTGVLLGRRQPVCEEEGLELTFPTPSGKIELFSKQLREAGFDPLPNYTPPEPPPAGMFRLLFGRAPVHSFGRTTNNRLLKEAFPENELWVNDRVCAELGLKGGDRVMLANQDEARSGPIRVRATRRIRPDCVYMVHGWGSRNPQLGYAYGKGASDSDLITRYVTDPIMGGTGMNVNFVSLERV